LKQTGLFDEFLGARNKLSGATSAVDRLAEQARVKQGDVNAIQKTLEETMKSKGVAEDVANKYSDFFTELKDKNLQTADVASKAGSVIKSMRKDGFIDSATYDKLLGDINDVKTKYADAAEARKEVGKIVAEGVLLFAGYESYRFIRARL
jgi:hypothetical protein